MIPIEKINKEMEKFLKSPEKNKINFDLMANTDEDETLINKTKARDEQVQQQIKVDWTSKMNPTRDQLFCGSCWAFSTIAAIEGNYNIRFGNSPVFSEQELVDCSEKNYDCLGGFPERALDYIKENGIAYGNEYPYISGYMNQKDVCKSSTTGRNMIIEDYEYCPLETCTKTQLYSMLQKGPVTVLVDADGGTESARLFKLYTEGIIENMPCTKPTHAVVLVGSDYDDRGQYLIGRNSWGAGWGDKGNFKIRAYSFDKTCFMESFGVLPIIKNSSNPIRPPVVQGCLKFYSECGFKGKVKEICENTPIIENFSLITGFEIGKFKNVKIYTSDQNCKGTHYILDQSNACFQTNGLPNLVNNVKSIIVDDQKPPSGCIWVYDQNCFSGNKLEICANVPDLNASNFGNRISSINFGPNIADITIYLDAYYQGSYTSIQREITGMADTWIDKDIESIKITKYGK